MIVVRCKQCNKEITSSDTQTRSCGCPNMTSLHGDTVSANDMGKVELLQSNKNVKKASLFSPQELEYQEARRHRKVRKLNFEER